MTKTYQIQYATTIEEITLCQPVIQQLIPKANSPQLVIQYMKKNPNYKLLYVQEGSNVMTVGGYVVTENLIRKKYLYIFDLVSNNEVRSKGYGAILLEYIKNVAKRENCIQMDLDSGTYRIGAHRFYFGQGMIVQQFHFKSDVENLTKNKNTVNEVVHHAKSEQDILLCVPLLQQLYGTNLTSKDVLDFCGRNPDYNLRYIMKGNQVISLVGYRIGEGISRGKFMLIEEIVTDSNYRDHGYGATLMNSLKDIASQEHCLRIDMDIDTQNHRGHKFLMQNDIILQAFHFHSRL
jgi:GNAT superfamily N-acetyltransferase